MTTYARRLGGLGNQLFQLAAAIGVDPDGDGRLVQWASEEQVDIERLAPALVRPVSERDVTLVRLLPPVSRYEQPLRELAAAFTPMPQWTRRPRFLGGYFQHPDWYGRSLPTIVDAIIAAAPPGTAPRPQGRVVVNVRGGDYVRLQRELPLSFYVSAAKAVRMLNALVVSGDVRRGEMVAGVLTAAGYPTAAPRRHSAALDDFWALATAPAVIMANSTFSWWAVQVGDELYRRAGVQRTVVAPKDWILGHGTELLEPRWLAVS